MLGKGFLKQAASDPDHIRDVCARSKRILLCMTDQHIGNFAISTPAIKALQRGFSLNAVTVDVIVSRGFVPLAQRLLDPANIIAHDMPKSFLGDIDALRRLRRQTSGEYDLLIGLGGGIRGSALARFAGVSNTIGLDRYRRSGLYTLRIEDKQPAHALGRYAQFGVCVGDSAPIIEPFTPLDGDGESIKSALQAAGIDPDRPLTVFHSGAGKENRRWPVERFARIADHVIEQHDHAVGILTPPGEEQGSDDMLYEMNRSESANKLALPLGQLLPFFDHAKALVCNESGPMHLAAMTRCAIIALYGPTDPARWSPVRTSQDVVVLRNGDCLTSITTDQVVRALDQALLHSAPAMCIN